MVGVVLLSQQQPVMLEGYAEPQYINWLKGLEGEAWKGPRFSDEIRPNNPVEVPLEYYFASVRCHMPPCSAYDTQPEPFPLSDNGEVVPEAPEEPEEEAAPEEPQPAEESGGGPSDNFPFDEPLSPLAAEGVNRMFSGPQPCDCEDDD
mmetsp:Transcript_5958/g.12064  ORF Transcript_5958/g.12064 Transcript_5958/m.12064 type:complete len:148 (-) Transcript_5958:300-743(-)